MKLLSTSLRSVFAAAVALALVGVGLAGCGGGSSGDEGPSRQMQMVTVNWIEGLAMTYMQEAILEDSLDMEVEVNEVQGGGIAFSSVAQGDADFFNEAWLPTTHDDPWKKQKDRLQKLGYTYKGTSAGLAVPAYVEVDSMPDLAEYRQGLSGQVNGIEPGANVNDQTRRTLERYGLSDQFEVAAASGPATWQALKTAVDNQQPIVVTAWKPHWKWSVYDLKYIDGAHTGHNVDIWGEAEDIFTIVGDDFVDKFPQEVVCFLKEFEANDQQVGSLMDAFRNRGDTSKREAAQQWIQEHPDHVTQWMQQTRECAASSEPIETLPDDATFSS